MMKFNRRQRDGIADLLDKIGLAAVVAILAGAVVENELTAANVTLLVAVSLVSLIISVVSRGGD